MLRVTHILKDITTIKAAGSAETLSGVNAKIHEKNEILLTDRSCFIVTAQI